MHREPSVDLRAVVADVLRKQDWYRDFRLNAGDAPVPFVGHSSLQSDSADGQVSGPLPEERVDSDRLGRLGLDLALSWPYTGRIT